MPNNHYDLDNIVRDVAPDFMTLIEQSPSFLKLLGGLGTSLDIMTGAPLVKAHKHEWVNESLSPVKSAIASFDSDGDGTGVNVASTVGFNAGDIVRFESSTGASKTEQARIASVDSATDLTIVRDYAGSTGVTLIVGDVMILVSSPKNESSDAGSGLLIQGTLDYNYTEIFDEIAELSNTSKATYTYDKASSMAHQVMGAMVRLARKIENSVIHGLRLERTSSSVSGTSGGVLQYLKAAGGNINTSGGALGMTHINDTLQSIYDDGGSSDNYVILCSPNQARKISALNTSGTNPVVFKDNTVGQTLGNFVTAFIGDLPVNGGLYAKVFVAQSMVKDQVAILDMNKIQLAVMRGLTMKDATQNGSDYDKQRLLTELTLQVKNGTKAHGIITGLNL